MARFVLSELARFRNAPPFISYVKAQNQKPEPDDDAVQHFLICRYLQPSELSSSAGNVSYVSYKAPAGRLASIIPGETGLVVIPRPHGIGAWQDSYTVLCRDQFLVGKTGDAWDAKENQVLFPATLVEEIPSLIEFLTQPEAPFGPAKPRRRKATEKFELRDLAIVDAIQDEIFRLPISTFLLVTGAPGTGKTTVAIKRLAQKTRLQYLLPEEKASLSEEQLRPLFEGPTSWALFMPNELLRNYLKEALAQEQLAASDDRLLVWSDHKITIARDALRYLKVGDRGFLRLSHDLLQCTESRRLAEWTLAFRDFFSTLVRGELALDFDREAEQAKSDMLAIGEKIKTTQDQIEALRQESALLAEQASTESHADAREKSHLLEQCDKGRSAKAEELRPLLRADNLWTQLSQTASAAREPGSTMSASRLARLAIEIRTQLDVHIRPSEALPPPLRAARAAIERITDKYSANSLLQRIPIAYHQFRLKKNSSFSFFKPAAMSQVNDRCIDPREIDTLIYMALSLIRETSDTPLVTQTRSDLPAQRLINQFRTIVAVDEAADFSAVELACICLLANPAFNSVTFAGDLMQRMTREGLDSWSELSLLLPPHDNCPLKLSYRQSARLLTIAAELYRKFVAEPPPFESAYAEDPTDPAPLLVHATDANATADWLTARILEIYRYNREQLPSIAIFVATEADVAQVHDLIAPRLLDHAIDTDACFGGKVLGTQAKVRIFNVKYIKGLEFEAVFFLSIDDMARNEPGLTDKYLYVGLTRARNFLAVSYREKFPSSIEFVKPQFASGTWQYLLAEKEQ